MAKAGWRANNSSPKAVGFDPVRKLGQVRVIDQFLPARDDSLGLGNEFDLHRSLCDWRPVVLDKNLVQAVTEQGLHGLPLFNGEHFKLAQHFGIQSEIDQFLVSPVW